MDGYLSDKNDKRIYRFPIDDAFHAAIFQEHKIWNSYIQLRKLKDYYGTVKFNDRETKTLADDLVQYLPHIRAEYQESIKELIRQLNNSRTVKSFFAGD